MKCASADDMMIDEMSIVDVLTKLIFNADARLEGDELLVIDLLAQVDTSLKHASRRYVSEYLRSMGVDEMIKAVNRIKQIMECQQELVIAAKQDNYAYIRG